MKKSSIYILITIVFLILLLTLLYITFIQNSHNIQTSALSSVRPKIIVDAGHGGEDGGAVGFDGTVEKDINLDIALRLEKILNFYGYDVIMTRVEDKMTCDNNITKLRSRKISDIKNRFKIIEENSDAIFVSIHQNKYSDRSQHGAQVFFSKNNAESERLAKSIQSSIAIYLQPDNKRVVKKSGTEIFLLYYSKIPSVLVECGFISNQNDLNNLKNENYRIKTALLIADGIVNYTVSG